MHSLLQLIMLQTSLLTYSALANPAPPLASLDTQIKNINPTNRLSLNTSLSAYPPEGPRGFECLVVALSALPIQPKDIFVTVIEILKNITQADFDSRTIQRTT